MRIRMNVEGAVITATLEDTDTARDFASLLPLTLALEDYASTEKISDLPRRLSTTGAPAGTAASSGDIAYTRPGETWRCSTSPSATRRGWSRSDGSTPASRSCASPVGWR